jgi:hypothetical protein
MRDRQREFSLSLHPEKTRLIEFGRFAAQNCKRLSEFPARGFYRALKKDRPNGKDDHPGRFGRAGRLIRADHNRQRGRPVFRVGKSPSMPFIPLPEGQKPRISAVFRISRGIIFTSDEESGLALASPTLWLVGCADITASWPDRAHGGQCAQVPGPPLSPGPYTGGLTARISKVSSQGIAKANIYMRRGI